MAKTASAVVLAGNGINCEIETAHACRLGGFERVDIVTIWELLAGERRLDGYDLLMLPGGFLDGDDLGSAKAQANRLLRSRDPRTGLPIVEQLMHFVREGKLIFGICNGFQLAVKLGILPALGGEYMVQQATITHNDSGKFEDRWTYLKTNPESPCVFTKGIKRMYLPVRHGEGKFVCADTEVLRKLKEGGQVAINYINPESGEPTITYPDNPNGSQFGIAGVCDSTGRIFGLMPHPEAFLHRTNHPRWTREELPEEGDGLRMFRNAYEYVKANR